MGVQGGGLPAQARLGRLLLLLLLLLLWLRRLQQQFACGFRSPDAAAAADLAGLAATAHSVSATAVTLAARLPFLWLQAETSPSIAAAATI